MGGDTELLARLRRGDQQAFREVVEAYSARVYRLALGMLGDPAEAEDALQETFISVFRGLPSFRGDSGLGTWIYRIAANASLMRLRRRKEALSLDAALDEGLEPRIAPPVSAWDWDPEEYALSSEIRQVMDHEISELPDTLRIVFLMRDVEGMPASEVGDALGLSVAAVKSRLHRARIALRDRLNEYFASGEGSG